MWQESHEAFLKQAEMKTVLDVAVLRRSDTEHSQGSAAETFSGDRIITARLWVNMSLPFVLSTALQGQCGEAKTPRRE